ncbi:MAG TPA: hypothetical protein DCM71_19335 [Runella sp.]|nr:hypothetical protein [Runella sp.]
MFGLFTDDCCFCFLKPYKADKNNLYWLTMAAKEANYPPSSLREKSAPLQPLVLQTNKGGGKFFGNEINRF